MPRFHVGKSVEIAAPVAEVFSTVRDFRSWPSWSPWLIAEPECDVQYEPDGNGYRWEGEIVGLGEMKVSGEKENERIDYELQFFKPWKSQARVVMRFFENPENDSPKTRVVWEMNGTLPIFLGFMKKSMTAFIGMDYERGLAMLRDKLEQGEVSSQLEFSKQNLEAYQFVGIRTRCEIPSLGLSMEADIVTLEEWIKRKNLEATGAMRSFYHKWDVIRGVVEYSLGFPVERAPENLPPGTTKLDLPAMETYAVTHTGTYRHLGNAWAAGLMHGRAKRFKQRRGIHPFEVYETRREDAPAEDLVTTVHFPLK